MISDTQPLVVKIGGSLLDQVPALVPVFKESGRPLLIVPGGGRFADLVRDVTAGDETAHWMAVLAMEQVGWYIAGQGLPSTDRLTLPEKTMVFLPYAEMRRRDPLPHTWDVTSDTIAAWAAATLGLDLLLLKSVDGIVRDGHLIPRVRHVCGCDEVDGAFLDFIFTRRLRARIVNGRKPEWVREVLAGRPVPGTEIDPSY